MIHQLKPDNEFRFEVLPAQNATLRLLSGTAEIFGCELAPNKEYKFSGVKSSVFTFDGATIEVKGNCAVEYVSTDSIVHQLLNVHICCEKLLKEATGMWGAGRNKQNSEAATAVPRIVVVGAGRNTACRTLLNYAVRNGRTPTFVDADVANGSVVGPGVLCAVTCSRLLTADDGFPLASPLAFFYGSCAVAENVALYKTQLQALCRATAAKLAMQPIAAAPVIVAMPAWHETHGSDLLDAVCDALKGGGSGGGGMTMIVVLGNERLFSTLKRRFEGLSSSAPTLINVPRSPGHISRDAVFRRFESFQRIREYFYGRNEEFYPYAATLAFSDVTLWRIDTNVAPPSSALPIGATRKLDELTMQRVAPSNALLYSVLGISSASFEAAEGDEAAALRIATTPILGLLYVSEVDVAREKIIVLSTCPGALPSRTLLVGGVKWLEAAVAK